MTAMTAMAVPANMTLGDLAGKRILITGGSTGIGAAVALGFAAQGARLALHYNASPEAAEALFALRKADHKDVDKAIAMFEAAGVTNIGAWGYRACGAFSNIASQDADGLWKRLCGHYARLKKSGARKRG